MQTRQKQRFLAAKGVQQKESGKRSLAKKKAKLGKLKIPNLFVHIIAFFPLFPSIFQGKKSTIRRKKLRLPDFALKVTQKSDRSLRKSDHEVPENEKQKSDRTPFADLLRHPKFKCAHPYLKHLKNEIHASKRDRELPALPYIPSPETPQKRDGEELGPERLGGVRINPSFFWIRVVFP